MEKKEKQLDENYNIWCELDPNLLGEIMGRLSLTDQARFRVVCKNWRAVRPIIISKSLPWFFCFDRRSPTMSKCLDISLYEPLSPPNLVSVHKISLVELGIPSPCYKKFTVSIRHNWLLFICTSTELLPACKSGYFILYSLLTKKTITLPRLNTSPPFNCWMIYTTEPDSPNCVFVLLNTDIAGKVTIITYRNGDASWIAREFDKVVEFLPCFCRPIYIRGIICIVSPYGQLASYNIVDGEFKFENLSVDELFRLNHRSERWYRLFELNGELMLAYFDSRRRNNTSLGKRCIKMYDWSNKVWIPVSTLGDNALFVGDQFIEVTTVNTRGMRINGVSNKLYHFHDGKCLIYSIEDGELVEFKSINSNLLEDGCGNLPEYKYNRDISFSDVTKAVHWLDPPCVRY